MGGPDLMASAWVSASLLGSWVLTLVWALESPGGGVEKAQCLVLCPHERCSVMSDSLRPHGLYSPWNSPGQNTGVRSVSILKGTFPT